MLYIFSSSNTSIIYTLIYTCSVYLGIMAVVKLCPDDSDFDSSVKHCRLQMHWEEQIDATAMYWTPDDTKIVQQ